jgi:SIR2-like domain
VIIDTERNRTAYLRLVELIRSGRALAFAGTGVTCTLGYPDWDGLIARLAAEVRQALGEDITSNGQQITVEQVLREFRQRPLVQAQILKENLGEIYFPLMAKLFGPVDRTVGAIADLVSLPFKHFLTSNYDQGLELHHSPSNRPIVICLHHESAPEFITHFGDENYGRRIVHVHGRHDEPMHIILTEEDYGRYVHLAILDEFWRIVPAAGRLVFFGFGFRDLDLLHTFRRRQMVLRDNHQGEARHFAVMPLEHRDRDGAVTVAMRMQYGIEPVFFPHPGAHFAEYDNLLSMLKADITGKRPEQLGEGAPTLATIPTQEVQAEEPTAAVIPAEEAPAEQAPAAVIPAQEVQPAEEMTGTEEMPAAVLEGIEQLRQITRSNIARRRTGDLE